MNFSIKKYMEFKDAFIIFLNEFSPNKICVKHLYCKMCLMLIRGWNQFTRYQQELKEDEAD